MTAQIKKNAKNDLASMGYYTIFPQKIFKLTQEKKINATQFLILSFFISKISSLDHNELKFTHGDIVKNTGVHRNTVLSSLQALENLGLIHTFKNEKLQGQPNTYVFDLDVLEALIGAKKIMHKNCAKDNKVMHKKSAKGYAQELCTSYYSNNYVIKNLSKGFASKIVETLEKIKSEKNIEREILLSFLDEKNLDYFNAIQNKANPFTYIKNGFENWIIDFEDNKKQIENENITREKNKILLRW